MAMGWEMHFLVALNKIYWYMQISWLSAFVKKLPSRDFFLIDGLFHVIRSN